MFTVGRDAVGKRDKRNGENRQEAIDPRDKSTFDGSVHSKMNTREDIECPVGSEPRTTLQRDRAACFSANITFYRGLISSSVSAETLVQRRDSAGC